MTKMTSIQWDLLASMAYNYENYLEEGTTVGSRGQEELIGTIIEVDYTVDDTDICYLVDWGYGREEWVSRDEIYFIENDDTSQLVNPQTGKYYTYNRIQADEVGWYSYSKMLNKMATYTPKQFTLADKILYRQEMRDRAITDTTRRLDELTEELVKLVEDCKDNSKQYRELEQEHIILTSKLMKLTVKEV